MAFPKFHGINLANNSWIENLHIERLATDPAVTAAGRFWFNTAEKVVKYSTLDGAGALVIRAITDSAALQTAVTDLQTLISQEATDRAAADAVLQGLIDVLEQDVIDLQTELDATQAGAGLGADGAYTAPAVSNYLAAATSLSDADQKLDAAIKAAADQTVTDLSGKVSKSGDSMTGNLAMQDNKVTGLAAPTAAGDAVNKAYVDGLVSGISWEQPVVAVVADAVARDALTGLVAGDRVAVEGDDAIYTYDGAAFDAGVVLNDGEAFFDKSNETGYVFNGTTLTQFTGAGQINAGIGLVKNGNTIDVNLGAGIAQLPSDEVGLDVSVDGGLMLTEDGVTASTGSDAQLAVKLDGTSLTKGVDGVKVSDAVMSDIASKASQTEVDATQAGAGLAADGSYASETTSNYINAATSLKSADALLDAALKAVADRTAALESDTAGADSLAALQAEVDATQAGSGLGTDGAYAANATSNYLATATSLKDADDKLDAQIKVVADAVADEATARAADVDAEETRALAAEAAIQAELDATQTGAGLGADGAYAAEAAYNETTNPTGVHFISTATSLKDADKKLDAALKAEEAARIAADAALDGRLDTIEAASGAGAAQLKSDINAGRFTFKSATAATTHVVAHNLNAEFLTITVMVEGADLKYRNDIVPIEETDSNTLTIELSEARNIKVSVQNAADLA